MQTRFNPWRQISLFLVAAVAVSGCGAEETTADPVLTVYISAPLIRDSGVLPQDAIDAAALALDDAGSNAGGVDVALRPVTGSDPGADPSLTAALNARTAGRDSSAIAYIGEFGPEATAASVPITNGAGIPQVAPVVVRGELLREREGGSDVPTGFQTSGERTLIALYGDGGGIPPLTPEGLETMRRFKQAYGRRPGPSAPGAYEAMALVLDALDRAGDPLDRASVTAALLATSDRASILGTYSIDPSGAARFEPDDQQLDDEQA